MAVCVVSSLPTGLVIHCRADCVSASVSLATETFFYDQHQNQNLSFFRNDHAERVNGRGKSGS